MEAHGRPEIEPVRRSLVDTLPYLYERVTAIRSDWGSAVVFFDAQITFVLCYHLYLGKRPARLHDSRPMPISPYIFRCYGASETYTHCGTQERPGFCDVTGQAHIIDQTSRMYQAIIQLPNDPVAYRFGLTAIITRLGYPSM